MERFRAHGLTVVSEIGLPGLAVGTGSEPADLTVSATAPSLPDEVDVDAGVVLAHDDTPGRQIELVSTAGWHRLKFVGGEMWFDPDVSTIHVVVDGSDVDGVLGWLVGGLGLATAIMLRGDFVVHATAIELDGVGQLLMAPSGHGKSLSAAVACASGARLVAEDTVRLVRDDVGGWSAAGGSPVVRTRRSVAEMEARFPPERVAPSSDGRVLIDMSPRPGTGSGAPEPVHVSVLRFVALDGDADVATVHSVDPLSAMTAVLGHLRVPGVVDSSLVAAHFDLAGELVDATQATTVRVPWKGELDPFSSDLMKCLRR